MVQVRRLDHIGVVVRSIDAGVPLYRERFDLAVESTDEVSSPPVRLAYLRGSTEAGSVDIQLVEPTGPSPIADFLENHGEGLHHICFQVPNIAAKLRKLPGEEQATIFPGGRSRPACFLTQRVTGVLVEFTEVDAD